MIIEVQILGGHSSSSACFSTRIGKTVILDMRAIGGSLPYRIGCMVGL